MDIETVKKIISENLKGFPSKIRKIRKSELYYENKNDILRRRNPLADRIKDKDPDNPLRNAVNRISHSSTSSESKGCICNDGSAFV